MAAQAQKQPTISHSDSEELDREEFERVRASGYKYGWRRLKEMTAPHDPTFEDYLAFIAIEFRKLES